MKQISARKLSLGYQNIDIINNLNLDIPQGKITILIGANGCGKSTLLKGIGRILKPRQGAVYLDGKAIHQQKALQSLKVWVFFLKIPLHLKA